MSDELGPLTSEDALILRQVAEYEYNGSDTSTGQALLDIAAKIDALLATP